MATTNYNTIIRNKIKDFIGSKKWSVSRFAARYVEAYIDLYSRQEAPSTSTARKLVEEDGHQYSEKEVTVLDSFTHIDFYQTWLDGEKAKLIERTNRYLGTDNGGTSIDSPAMLHDTIAKLSRKGVNITLDDIEALLNRFVSLDCAKPFILESTDRHLLQAALRHISPRFSVVRIMPENAVEEVKTLIRSAKTEVTIGWIYLDSYHRDTHIPEMFGKDVFILRFGWSKPMEESLYRKYLTPEQEKRIGIERQVKSCLTARPDWNELFCNMVEECVKSPWVKVPELNTGQWMLFLESMYRQLKSTFEVDNLKKALLQLIERGMPEDWLTNNCNQLSLLECMSAYEMWKAKKTKDIEAIEDEKVAIQHHKALNHFEQTDYEELMLLGNTEEVERTDWDSWFEERLMFFLVDFDFNKLVELSNTSKLHKRK